MNKIPTLYDRDPDHRARVLIGHVTPGCEWVLDGEGIPTRKYDGTCVAYLKLTARPGWWARREVKPGRDAPDLYQPIAADTFTGKTVGWEPIWQSSFYSPFLEALEGLIDDRPAEPLEGTYELIGPKINRNPEHAPLHKLVRHAAAETIWPTYGEPPEALVADVARWGWEGLVWHHPDGRMAKLKARDLP